MCQFNKQRRLTKRELKSLKGPNASVQHSLAAGELHYAGGKAYSGKTPEYSFVPNVGFMKTSKGIPFVRVTLE